MDMRVTRVTKTEFELEDGRVYQHLLPLEKVPSVKQFQSIYDRWEQIITTEEQDEDAGETSQHRNSR